MQLVVKCSFTGSIRIKEVKEATGLSKEIEKEYFWQEAR